MNDHEASPAAPDVEKLFALGGGRVSRGLERLQLARDARLHSGRLAVFLARTVQRWRGRSVDAVVFTF